MQTAYRPVSLSVVAAAAAIVAIIMVSEGGPSSSNGDSAAGDRELALVSRTGPSCDVGGVSPLEVPRVGGIIVMRSPATILACGKPPFHGRFYIVGFDTNQGICMSVDSIGEGTTFGVICRNPQSPWLDFCRGEVEGCILRYSHDRGFTQISGVISPEVRGIRASVAGAEEIGGVAVAQLGHSLLRGPHRQEPLGFFAALLPGCVPLGDVRLEMLDAEGARIGVARETGGSPLPCR